MRKLPIVLLLLLVSVLLIVSCGDNGGEATQTTNAPEQTNFPAQTEIKIDPTVNSFKIDGVDISEFKLFALDGIEEAIVLAENISKKYLGVDIPRENGSTLPEGDKWIILDRQSYDYHSYSMTVENGNLYIKGSFRSFPKALDNFISYLDGSHGTEVNMTSADNFSGKLPTVKPLYSTKEDLLAIYEYAADSNYTLYGEHSMGGSLAELEASIRENVGDGPAILDYDMIGAYIGQYPRSQVSRIICEALEFASKGGILTTFCHWQNPNEEARIVEVKDIYGNFNLQDSIYRGSIGSKELWTSVLTDGTDFNKKWKAQLDFNAEIYQAFKDLGMPVTFRPMLEANTGNMWWCYYHEECMLTGDDLRDMWNYVYDYYVNDLGLDNILWTYSPNAYTGGVGTTFYYPGDDKCDLVGMDWYIDATMSRNLANNYGYQALLEYGKPTGLCEWGVTGGLADAFSRTGAAQKFSCRELVDIIELAKDAGLTLTFLETYSGYFGSSTWLPDGEALNETLGIILLDDMPDIVRNALG